MKKNNLHKQNGFTLVELLLAGMIATIFLAGVVKFSLTAFSTRDIVTNEAYAVNQAKNAFNYINQDVLMAGMVSTTSSNFPLTLSWINYPKTQTTVVYSIVNGNALQRYFYSMDPNTGVVVTTTDIVANSVNAAQTNCVWSEEVTIPPKLNRLTVNLTISKGSVNLKRQFIVTPRVVQSSSQILSTITLTALPNPASYGAAITLTATLVPSTITSGTITFIDGSNPIQIIPVIGGQAIATVTNLSIGVHSLTAVYSGDANYRASTSTALMQTVNPMSTSTSLTSSPPSPSVYGQSVTFTATLNPSTATGTVQFKIDGTNLGTAVTLVSGIANSDATTTLTTGTHSITAVYSGDSNYATSTGSLTQTVSKCITSVALSSSPNPSNLNQLVTITATVSVVSPGVGIPTGTVTFKEGSTTLGTGTLTSGQTTFTTSTLAAGTHSITAIYNGDPNNNASPLSAVLTQTVVGAPDASHSTLSPTSSSIIANGISTQVLIVQAKDANNFNLTTGGAAVTITRLSGTGTISAVTDNLNGIYTAIVTSSTTVSSPGGVFVATLNGSTVNSSSTGGGSQTQATVNYITGNTIEITTSMFWSSITTGSGPGGQPSPADTINIHGAGTTPATGIFLTVDVPNGQAYAINVNTSSSGTPSYATLTFQPAQGVTVGTITIGSTGSRKGIVDMSAGTPTTGAFLTITNSVSLSSGNYTFTSGYGTVVYGSAGAQTVYSALSYYNLSTNGSGTKTLNGAETVNNLTVGGATTLTLGGALTVNGNLVINTSTILNVGSYDITLKGNWTNSGTFTQGTRTVTLNGTTAQSMSGLTTFYNLTLNNAAGLIISNDETITHTLTLTAGKITTGTSIVIIPSGGSTSRTSGYVYGNLRKWVSTTTPKFEVGAANYNQVDLTITTLSTAGYMTVTTNAGQHPNVGTSTIHAISDVSTYWTFTNSGTVFTSFTAKFAFVAGDVTGGSPTGASWKVGRYSGGAWNYPAVGTRNAAYTLTGSITFANAFGDFILGQ